MHPLKVVKIKIPFGFLQSNPQILAERVEPILFIKNMFMWNTLLCIKGECSETKGDQTNWQSNEKNSRNFRIWFYTLYLAMKPLWMADPTPAFSFWWLHRNNLPLYFHPHHSTPRQPLHPAAEGKSGWHSSLTHGTGVSLHPTRWPQKVAHNCITVLMALITRTQVLELGPRDGSLFWSGLVMRWWCTDDALMMCWWCADDALIMRWLCADDALMMH